MKLAIVTRADENIKKYTDITHPLMKNYAKKCAADFIVLSHTPPKETIPYDGREHYRLLEVKPLLEKTYDRVLLLDSDMLIIKNCPNIFEHVEYDKIGSIYEDKGSRKNDRNNRIKKIQREWGDVGWSDNYTNAGTFLVSKPHLNIFDSHGGKYWKEHGSADVHLSYLIHYYGHKVHELSFKWNHMTMFSESWNNNENRFHSYIIHYAGGGIFDGNVNNKLEQMKKDFRRMYE
jgi:lipopolysaccharide biosynthesis glycosyltransferase